MRLIRSFLVQIWRIHSLVFGLLLLGLVVSELNAILERIASTAALFAPQEFSPRLLRLYHILIYGYFGLIIGRYVSRFLPLHLIRASEFRRYPSINSVVGILAAFGLGVLSPWAIGEFYWLFPGIMYYVGLISVVSAVKPPSERTILYLRRFAFDRVVFGSVMSGVPPSGRLVGLIPANEPVQSWDPLDTALVGLRILSPIQSTPCFVRSSDEHWISNVTFLARRAKLVVIDLSQISEAILTELSILKEIGALHKTIIILPETNSSILADLRERFGINTQEVLCIIPYKLTWRASWIRIGNGLLLLMAAVYIITSSGVSVLFGLYTLANIVNALAILFFKKTMERRTLSYLKKTMYQSFLDERHDFKLSFPLRFRKFLSRYRNIFDAYPPSGKALNFLLWSLVIMYLSHHAWWAYGPFLILSYWFSFITFDNESEFKGGVLFVLSVFLPWLLLKSLEAVRGG